MNKYIATINNVTVHKPLTSNELQVAKSSLRSIKHKLANDYGVSTKDITINLITPTAYEDL